MRPGACLVLLPLCAGVALPPLSIRLRPSVTGRVAVAMAEDMTPIKWFPLNPSAPDTEASPEGMTMPLFPLGVTYLPYTSPVLNIFEPRYRAMYNDILFNGARRFMVTSIDQETGQLAEAGVVFYLDELKEVSEQTQDRVKYVGSHSVVGRVKLLKVLNPSVAGTRETYLKAEVEPLEDVGGPASKEEQDAVKQNFLSIVEAQASLGEEPRFTQAVKEDLSFDVGTSADDKGLWGTILLWQQFLEQRNAVIGQKMQRDIQKEVVNFLKDNSIKDELVNARGEIRLEDLPAPLVNEIRSIQNRYREELDAMDADPYGQQFQRMVQTDSHSERLQIFNAILDKERKRLSARATLQSLFKK